MTKQEEIREGVAKIGVGGINPLENAIPNEEGYKAADSILAYLDSQGVVLKVEKACQLPLMPFYIRALQGEIAERHIKQGITDIAILRSKIMEELPQVICDVINGALANYELVESLIEE